MAASKKEAGFWTALVAEAKSGIESLAVIAAKHSVTEAAHSDIEVVTRRYDAGKPIVLSTNKAFSEWGEVFPHAACVVTLVDRLIHRAEMIRLRLAEVGTRRTWGP